MQNETLAKKLMILADAAKYDASCASSGSNKRDALKKGGLGSAGGSGICHAYTPDGRCVSLLKILLTNSCVYDCAYCINRSSSNVPRARFSVDEVVSLTLDFYRRNYIEGLFLSSGIIRSANYTMELLGLVAKKLRIEHQFHGYIHLKTIAEADEEVITEAGLYADRLSVNVELPTEQSLNRLAPDKHMAPIKKSMKTLKNRISESKEERQKSRKAPRFAPAGQSTQMIIGADPSKDSDILRTSTSLYGTFNLKRVYYSAFSPIPDSTVILPLKPPPLVREHRLYQADWLMRFYGFSVPEIEQGMEGGMIDLTIDPKTAWALKRRDQFPVDINKAPREMLLRIPGLGVRSVDRIIATRRHHSLRFADVAAIAASIKKAKAFFIALDWHPAGLLDQHNLAALMRPAPQQLELFG